MKAMEPTQVKLPRKQVKALKRLVKRNEYSTISEAVRCAVDNHLVKA